MLSGFVNQAELEQAFLEQDYLRQLEVFGPDRMAEVEGNEASPELVVELASVIENICSGPNGTPLNAAQLHTHDPNTGRFNYLSWNPAGVVGTGFGPDSKWDGALASVQFLSTEQRWVLKPGGIVRPGKYEISEGMYIDLDGKAYVRRRIESGTGKDYRRADKPATKDEVEEAIRLVSSYSEAEANDSDVKLPICVEIGYGLDPMAVLGNRKFQNKIYVGVDPAVGNYENARGEYSNAVQDLTASLGRTATEGEATEHTFYVTGSAEQLPLKNKSVREVFMSNILNAPIEQEDKVAMLQEIGRVIEGDGHVVIRVNWHQDEWPAEKTLELLRSNGFHSLKVTYSSTLTYRNMELQYGTPQEVAAPPGYYIVAQYSNKYL